MRPTMTFCQSLLRLVAVSMSVALVACGGSSTMSTTPIPPIAVFFSSAAPAALQVNGTASLAVVISNDSSNAGVKWSVTCGSNGPCGSFSTSGPGTSTTYTAPSVLPSGNNNSVTVTATSTTDSTKGVSATITITAPGIGLLSSSAYPPNALQ